MSANREYSRSAGGSSHRGAIILLTFLLFTAIGISFGYFHDYHLVSVATTAITWILSASSLFRFTLLVGFGGSLLSIPLLRRRKATEDQATRQTPLAIEPEIVHPWRPAQDTQFKTTKVRTRGRISRNREGERLPASDPD